MKDLFKAWDVDESGLIDLEEFRSAVATLHVDVRERDVDALFEQYDVDGSGAIDFWELDTAIQAGWQAQTEGWKKALRVSIPDAQNDASFERTPTEQVLKRVMTRTDELYTVIEKLRPAYQACLASLLRDGQLEQDLLEKVYLTNPVEVHVQATDQYRERFADGLPEACVHNALCARIVCTTGAQMLQVAERILEGYTDSAGSTIRVVQLKNNFANLMPTHFRKLTFSLLLVHEGISGYVELQVHHAPTRAYDSDRDSASHYDFFRGRVSTGHGSAEDIDAHVDATLDKVLRFLIEAAAVPVLLSLLVLVFSTSGAGEGGEDLDMLPQSPYELYSMATQSAVIQRLKLLGKTAAADLAGKAEGLETGVIAEVEEEVTNTRAKKQPRKSAQGGSDWRKGAALPKSDAAADLGLDDAEITTVYKVVAKVFSLLTQGRQGLSELKQAYLPKDKRLRPVISKMIDSVVDSKPSKAREAAGLNMLRLVAVDNQAAGRREFTSLDVARSLVAGGRDMELPLWMRLDTEEVGVTLIKTLEGQSDSAPALYQFKHLSFQEGLFARDLLSRVEKQTWKGWITDQTAAEFLNNAYMNNVCRIAAGELGKRLAKQRPEWSFEHHRLNWIGKVALWALLKSNVFLTSINLAHNNVGPGASVSDGDADAGGLSTLFSSCSSLTTVSLAHNQLGGFSSKQLSRWLKELSTNHSLTSLELQNNSLGPDGVRSVASALRLCPNLQSLDLSRNQPGGRPEALIQLIREHTGLRQISIVEDDEKHLSSKAKTLIGEAMRLNTAHQLAFISCDAFELTPETQTLKWTSTLPADITLLAGALRSNSTLTSLQLDGRTIAETERTQLGKALLENTESRVGYCDDFELTPSTTELFWDMKEKGQARKGIHFLMGLLRANTVLQRVTFSGLGLEPLPLLAQAMQSNRTLMELKLEYQQQTLKGMVTLSATLPIQDLTGATGVTSIDLSAAGELSKNTMVAIGALMAKNKSVTSLRLSGTKLADEAGSILSVLGELCGEGGSLRTLDLSEVGLSDRGARKLFDAMMTGNYPALQQLILSNNSLRDLKTNGMLEMLRAEDCSLTMLDVSSNPLSGDAVLRALKLNSSLTELNVCSTELDAAGMRDLGTMLLQQEGGCKIKLLSCDHFEVRQETRAISFGGQPVSSAVLSLLCGILKRNETCETLDIVSAGIDAHAAKALETALSFNTMLKKLDARDNGKLYVVTETGEESMEGMEALCRGLYANRSITSVQLDNFVLPVKELKGTLATPELNFSESMMSNVSAVLLGGLLEKNNIAKALDLSMVKTASRLGHAIGRCLCHNTTLVSLILRDAELLNEGVAALADGLLSNHESRLKSIDLASNGIGPEGTERLAALLTSSTSLVKLDLTGNQLGAAGAIALMTALQTNVTLTALSVRDNDIQVKGAGAVAEALKTNSALSTLWLGKNKLGDEGIALIVNSLIANKAMSKVSILDLHKNGTTKVGHSSVAQLLAESPTLTALSLAGTKMQFTESDAMQTAAKEKAEIGRAKAVRLWTGSDMAKWPAF